MHVGVTARGQRYTSVGLPGTGVSWREYQRKRTPRRCDVCAPGHVHVPAPLAGVLFVLLAFLVFAMLSGGR